MSLFFFYILLDISAYSIYVLFEYINNLKEKKVKKIISNTTVKSLIFFVDSECTNQLNITFSKSKKKLNSNFLELGED